MRNITTILLLLLFSNIYSQNKLNFSENGINTQTELILKIAKILSAKNDTIRDLDWYKLKSTENLIALRNFQSEITNFEKEIDFYIDKGITKNEGIFYSIHYFIKENEEQYSKIYLLFESKKSVEVDDLIIDGKEIIDAMKFEWNKQNDIPVPPLPPSNRNK